MKVCLVDFGNPLTLLQEHPEVDFVNSLLKYLDNYWMVCCETHPWPSSGQNVILSDTLVNEQITEKLMASTLPRCV